MMTDRELMQQALKALETNNKAWTHLADSGDAGFWEVEEQPFYEINVKTIAALRERLAQLEQEPVAWMYDCGNGGRMYAEELDNVPGWTPLYTAPRSWQGLTDEEITEIAATPAAIPGSYVFSFARAIEAELKVKNNGQ